MQQRAAIVIMMILAMLAVTAGVGCQAHRPPRALPAPLPDAAAAAGEEIWIIQRPDDTQLPVKEMPRGGVMIAHLRGEKIAIPIEGTAIDAWIHGEMASVLVSQRFENPFAETIDAEYQLLLPEDAAVNDFLITIGKRRIRGIIRDRDEAEHLYSEAKRQGYTASLLRHDQYAALRQSIANVPANAGIEVDVRYVQPLPRHEHGFDFAAALVVAQPGGADWPGVHRPPSIDRRDPAIAVTVRLDAAGPITSVQSNHVIALRQSADALHRAEVRLVALGDGSSSFMLRFAVADEAGQPARGRGRIANQMRPGPHEAALRDGVLSPGAAFIAVDGLSRGARAADSREGSFTVIYPSAR